MFVCTVKLARQLASFDSPCFGPNMVMLYSAGLSVLYFIMLVFILFQEYSTVRLLIGWLCPELKNFSLVSPVSSQYHLLLLSLPLNQLVLLPCY